MTQVITGPRVARLGNISLGCSASIFNRLRDGILLTRRTDNGQWCLPGGRVEAGESVEEACVREVLEETHLNVRVLRLIGVYSDPNRLVVYHDGNQYHLVALNFEAEIVSGEPAIGDETLEVGYFSQRDVETMDILNIHIERIRDAFSGQDEPFIK